MTRTAGSHDSHAFGKRPLQAPQAGRNGAGLSVVKMPAGLHGDTMAMESEAGHRTEIKTALPNNWLGTADPDQQ